MQIEPSGKLLSICEDGGHWLALDAGGTFSKVNPRIFHRATSDGTTGLASAPNGSIYLGTWNGIVKLKADGSIANRASRRSQGLR